MGSILPSRSTESQPGLESGALNVVDLHNQHLRRYIPAASKYFPAPRAILATGALNRDPRCGIVTVSAGEARVDAGAQAVAFRRSAEKIEEEGAVGGSKGGQEFGVEFGDSPLGFGKERVGGGE